MLLDADMGEPVFAKLCDSSMNQIRITSEANEIYSNEKDFEQTERNLT